MSNHVEQAEQFFAQSWFRKAAQELQLALETDPENMETRYFLSQCLAKMQHYDAAVQELETVVQQQPDLALARYLLAQMHYEYYLWLLRTGPEKSLERIRQAGATIKIALQLDSETPEHWGLLGIIHMEEGNCLPDTSQSVDLREFFFGKQFAKHNKKQQTCWDDALHAAERGLALEPNHHQCTQLKAAVLQKLGRVQAAESILVKYNLARKMAGDDPDPESHSRLAWFALEAGKRTEALKHFQIALDGDPTLEEVRRAVSETIKRNYWFYRLFSRSCKPGQVMMVLFFVFAYVGQTIPAIPEWVLGGSLMCAIAIAALPWIFIWVMRFKPAERKYLCVSDMVSANYLVASLLCVAIIATISIRIPIEGKETPPFIFAALGSFPLMPVAVMLAHPSGRRRCCIATYTFFIAGLAAIGATLLAILDVLPPWLGASAVVIGYLAVGLVVLGALVSYWIGFEGATVPIQTRK